MSWSAVISGIDGASRMVLRGLDHGPHVFGEARTSKSGTGVQELRSNSVVEPNPAGDFLYICADALAPSRKNSGFETTAKSASGLTSRMMRSTSSPVPTGTVDLVMMTVKSVAISRVAS
jgi:hypothetical protein